MKSQLKLLSIRTNLSARQLEVPFQMITRPSVAPFAFTSTLLALAIFSCLLPIPEARSQICAGNVMTFTNSLLASHLSHGGRVVTDGFPSSCASPKTCPGTVTGVFQCDSYRLMNFTAGTVCYAVTLSNVPGCGANLLSEVYAPTLIAGPTTVCTNYVADQGNSVAPGTASSYSFNIGAGSTFDVVVLTENSGQICSSNYSLSITPCPSLIFGCPNLTGVVSGSGAMCAGSSNIVTVTVNGSGATPYTVALNNGGGTQTGIGSQTVFNFTVGPSATTTYSLDPLGSHDNNNCPISGSGAATVSVNPKPSTPTITATPSQVCVNSGGNQATAPASSGYSWSITGGTITSAADIQTITYAAGNGASVILNLTVSNSSGCTATNSRTISTKALPAVPNITPAQASPCANVAGNSASGPSGATSYAWAISNGTIPGATNLQTVTYTAGSSGSVGLTLRVSNSSGCFAVNSTNLPIQPDTVPPTINCPANITVTERTNHTTVVTFGVSASDNCSVSSVTATPPSGTAFPLGTTAVTVTARDGAGNSTFCTFNVTVLVRTIKYTVMDLGTLGGTVSDAYGINENGQVTGFSYLANSIPHAFLWTLGGTNGPASNPQMRDLGTLGGSMSVGCALNDGGQVAGYANPAGSAAVRAFLWSSNGSPQMKDLGLLNGYTNSQGLGVNNNGEVTGCAYNASGLPLAFRYTGSGPMQSLGVNSSGNCINSRGQIAVGSFRWTPPGANGPAEMLDLGGLIPGGSSGGSAINTSGQVAGTGTVTGGNNHAFLWTSGGTDGVANNPQMKDLGTLGGASPAYGINDNGEVVGRFRPSLNERAFIYSGAGPMQDLNDLIAVESGWELFIAKDINNQGQIVGVGRISGVGNHAFLLTPVQNCCKNSDYEGIIPPGITAETAYGWSATLESSADDGLVLRDLKLEDRYVAEAISIPYYEIQTARMSSPRRGELRPNDPPATPLRSRLVDFQTTDSGGILHIQATYHIDEIPGSPGSTLCVFQHYEFMGTNASRGLEPTGELDGHGLKPKVEYAFCGAGGDTISNLFVAQRQAVWVDRYANNTAGVFKDRPDFGLKPNPSGPTDIFYFNYVTPLIANPLPVESSGVGIVRGKEGDFDNIHVTFLDSIQALLLDGDVNGPPHAAVEAFHEHWRWAGPADVGFFYGFNPFWEPTFGEPLVSPGSDQDLEFAVVKYHPGEEDPQSYYELIDASPEFLDSGRQVIWLGATGHQNHDELFGFGIGMEDHIRFMTGNITPDIEVIRTDIEISSALQTATASLQVANNARYRLIRGPIYLVLNLPAGAFLSSPHDGVTTDGRPYVRLSDLGRDGVLQSKTTNADPGESTRDAALIEVEFQGVTDSRLFHQQVFGVFDNIEVFAETLP